MKRCIERESNLELLRVVAMTFIVLHHFIVHGLQLSKITSTPYIIFPLNNVYDSGVLLALNSFLVVGVNLFLLISGYYSIQLKWRSIISLWMVCIFYDYFQYSLSDYYSVQQLRFHTEPFTQVFTRSGWFITCYTALMLLSPLINKAIQHFSDLEMLYSFFGLSILNLWLGFHLKETLINDNGYTVMQFLYIYLIGRCLQRYMHKIKWHTLVYVGGYILCATLVTAMAMKYFIDKQYQNMWHQFSYHNPLVILSSIFLFLSFKTLTIRSRLINWYASSVIAIYLIHESQFIREKLYPYITMTVRKHNLFSYKTSLTLVGLFLIIMIGSVLIDKIRIFITKPIVNRMDEKAIQLQQYFEHKVLH